MDENYKRENLLQGPTRFRLKERTALETRVIELTEPCEILEPSTPLDLRNYANIVRKRFPLILTIFFVVFVIAAIATLKQKPVYEAQVVLDIQKENPDIPTLQELYAVDTVSDTYLKTEYSILASESLARQVINELHLDTLREFNARKWWSWSWPPKKEKSAVPQGFATGSAVSDRDQFQRVLEHFQDHLTIEPVSRSRLVAVRFDSRDANLAARVANAIASDFIDQNLQARWTATQTAADWLAKQLTTVKGKLEKSENDLQAYAHRNGLIFIQSDKGNIENVANERLQQLQEELTHAQAERYSKEAVYRLVQSGDYGSLPGVFDNRMLQDMTERLTELRREYAQLSATFNPDYPKVKEIQSQIDEIESALREERTRAANHITNEFLAAEDRENLVRQAFAEQQKQMHQIAEQSVQYNILKREVDTNRQLYEGLLQQLKTTGLSASLKASNIRIVDPAEPPTKPVKPKIPLNLALAATMGLALGICAAFLQERLDDTVRGADDVERLLGLSALALIPFVPPVNGNRRAGDLEHSSALPLGHNGNGNGSKPGRAWYRIDCDALQNTEMLEAFRSLRTSLLLSTADGPPTSLLVTSTQPAEGKTTVASNLAIALAQIGHRVLLVDADLRSPSVHRLFAITENVGLVNYLAGQQDWRSAVCSSGSARLDVLVCGPVPPNPAELLSSGRMEALIRSASDEYDFVVVDSAPMLGLADSRLLASKVSAVLLVVKNATIPREQLLHTHSGISRVGGNLIGVILNRVDLRTNGYYAGYNGPENGNKTVFDTPLTFSS